MKKYLIIKDPETGKYFTSDYDECWSRNIGESCKFDDEAQIQSKLLSAKQWDVNPFEYLRTLIIETIYMP